jgi:peptide/nickel transport system permease protein
MRQYILQRFLSTIPILLGIITLVFFVMRVLPGDPVSALVAQSGGSAEDIAQLRAEYELDRPLWVQYLSFLTDLGRGELGRSIFTGQSVAQVIWQHAPETIVLACAAIAIATALGLPLGIVAAVRQGTLVDKLCMSLSALGVSVPIALSGLVMILVLSLTLYWFPASGQGSIRHLVMPATAMGLASAGSIARVVRTELIEALGQDYIRVARAKGLSQTSILVHHALRNALIPVLTLIGLQFGFMLGGAAVTESVFARQGMGRTLVDAILYQDYPVVQGIVIVSAALYTAVNLVVDLAHYSLDPRISY